MKKTIYQNRNQTITVEAITCCEASQKPQGKPYLIGGGVDWEPVDVLDSDGTVCDVRHETEEHSESLVIDMVCSGCGAVYAADCASTTPAQLLRVVPLPQPGLA
jgi:hypothetical protein